MIIGVDPGRGKCGIALLHEDGRIQHREIVPRDQLLPTLARLGQGREIGALVIGDGTGSGQAKKELSALGWPIRLVDERETTLRARDRYWKEFPPRGLKRLIPLGMLSPPCSVDDWVAVILAERYLKNHRD